LDIVIRAAVAFVFVLFLTRTMGRRELGSLEPFDLIMLVVIGDLIQQGVTQNDFSVVGAILAGGTIAIMTMATSFLNWRFKRLRPILEGEPLILVQDGKLIERNLKRERITPEEVAEQARIQQVASFDEIRWAVLETNGQISIVPKKAA
jgi:uncharacterized membrane protein YcaP (DUF421 family)